MFKRLIFALLMFILVACGSDDPGTIPTLTPAPTPLPLPSSTPFPTSAPVNTPFIERLTPTPPQVAETQVRLVQANPGLDVVDIYLDDQLLGARFRPGDFATQALAVASGQRTIRIMTAGERPANATPLFEARTDLAANTTLLLYVFGDADDIQVQSYEQDLSPLPPNTARIDIIHAAPNTPPLTIIANTTPLTLAEPLAYRQQLGAQQIVAGEYTIRFEAEDELLTRLGRSFDDQQVYTILVLESVNRLETLVFSAPATPQTRLRVIHASADSPEVQVLLNDDVLAESIAFGEASPEFISVDAGRYRLQVRALNEALGDEPLVDTMLDLPPNEHQDLLIYNRFIDLQAGLFPVDVSPTPAQRARLIAHHVIPSETGISISNPLITTTLSDDEPESPGQGSDSVGIRFGGSTGPLLLSPGSSFITVSANTAGQTDQRIFDTPDEVFDAGAVYTYILAGRSRAETFFIRTDTDVDTEAAEVDPAQQVQIRAMNAQRTDEPITLTLSDDPIIEGLRQGESSSTVAIPPAASFEIRVLDAQGVVLDSENYGAQAGDLLTLYILGEGDATE
ncbi:MAG: DUF4397 domain-containing protein, partial [Anaerolineales bacterium]